MGRRQHHIIVSNNSMLEEIDPACLQLAQIPLTQGMAESIGEAWLEISPDDIVMVVQTNDLCDCGSMMANPDDRSRPIHYQDCFIIRMAHGLV